MSRISVYATVITVAVGFGCNRSSAQTKTQAPAASATPVAEITVVGCVQPSDQTATDASVRKDTTYMLTHAKSGKAGGDTTTGTSGTSGASGGSGAGSPSSNASTYRLSGQDAALTSEVGHQVEIVAMVEEPATAAAQVPKLKVERVRVVAVPCPEP